MPLPTIRQTLLGGRLGGPRFCQPLLKRQFMQNPAQRLRICCSNTSEPQTEESARER
jgi:hypothetical protein